MKSSSKFYYENHLFNQNQTAKPNVVWAADITTLKLFTNQKAYVFLCIDIHTNIIVASTISKTTITTDQITRTLGKAIEKRFKIPPIKKLIINTDRGTQFSSRAYNNFVEKYKNYFLPSMARENTPTDNAVAERFMRTFKEHAIYNTTIEEDISGALALQSSFNSYKACLNKYVKSLNLKPNSKAKAGPQKQDTHAVTATMLMLEPNHPKATSAHIGEDLRLTYVEQYKAESIKVGSLLAELAARKGELVEKTPFDDFENNLALQLIDNRLNEIYSIIQNNPDTTRQYVMEAIEPIEDSLTELHRKIDSLLPKDTINRQVLPLRDPINIDLFPFFFTNAGSKAKRRKDLKQAQLRLAYTLLYHTGLRVNEIRTIMEKDINNAVATSQMSVIHHKTKQAHIHVLSKNAVLKLKKLKPEMEVVFHKYQFKYLFGREEPMHKKSLVRLINSDLRTTCEVGNIPYNIKSHSFRINMISNLLKKTSVQHAAQIIGHNDIQSTMSYQRYALSKEEIQKLLDDIENKDC